MEVPLSDVGEVPTTIQGAIADSKSMAASWVSNQQHGAAGKQVRQLAVGMWVNATHTA